LSGKAVIRPASLATNANNTTPLTGGKDASDEEIFTRIATVNSPTCYYVDEGLENLVTYEYYVVATDLNETHKSQRSIIVSAVPHDNIPPAPPTNFDLEVIREQPPKVRLMWTRSVDDPLYQVEEPDSSREIARVSGFRRPGGVASPVPASMAGPAGADAASISAEASDAGGRGSSAYAYAGGPVAPLYLSAKEGEAAKAKAGESRGVADYYGATGPRFWTGKDRGFDAGQGDVETYRITKSIQGQPMVQDIFYYPQTPGNEVDYWDSDVTVGNIYIYTIAARDSENFSAAAGPVTADLSRIEDNTLAFAPPGSPYSPDFAYDPLGGGGSITAPFAETGWGASRTKPAKVITCKPNPVTGTATFTITLPAPCAVKLDVYDLAGRKVDTVLDKMIGKGGESILWQPSVPTGVYIYRLETPKRPYSGKVVVAR
jgi:hypothetical protein